jgi:hypothetical protein
MTEIDVLQANLEIMQGRLRAVEATVQMLVLTNGLPPEQLTAALSAAAQRVEACADALPMSDRTLETLKTSLAALLQADQERSDQST